MVLANKSVLLTGSTGFTGSHLYRELVNLGVEVVVLADQAGNPVDVRDWQSLNAFGSRMGQVDMVYHLAALMYVPFSFENPRETFEVNVLGTLNILELCRLQHVERMIFASSYVYGPPRYLPVDEDHPLKPANPYARSKVIGEALCRAFYEDNGLKCTILRPFNIFGERQRESFLIPSILNQAAGGNIELMDPEPKRDFLYVTDAIEAYIKAGEYVATDFEIFNIGSGVSYSVEEIVQYIREGWGQPFQVSYRHQRRKKEIMDVVADIRKAKRELSWAPRVEFKEGLRRYIEWYKAQLRSRL